MNRGKSLQPTLATYEDWVPYEQQLGMTSGLHPKFVFTWSPRNRCPYRIMGLRIETSGWLGVHSATVGGGMNLLKPVTADMAHLAVQDAEDPSVPVHRVSMSAIGPELDLLAGRWIVEPLFQHPIVLAPNSIRVALVTREHFATAVAVFARFLVPPNMLSLPDDPVVVSKVVHREPEAQRQFDIDALTRILDGRGVPRRMLERCGQCDAYKVKAELCPMCGTDNS